MLTITLLLLCVIAGANLLVLLGLVHRAVDAAKQQERNQAANQHGLSPGSIAPDFTISDLHGHDIKGSSLTGKARLLVCISTTCEVCKELLPHFKQMHALTKTHNIEFLLLSDDGVEQTRRLIQDYSIDLPTFSLGTHTYDFMQLYRLKDFPRYCFIDPDDRVTHSGYPSLIDKNWRALFETLSADSNSKLASAA